MIMLQISRIKFAGLHISVRSAFKILLTGMLVVAIEVVAKSQTVAHTHSLHVDRQILGEKSSTLDEPTLQSRAFIPIEKGLILDLNADVGVQTEDSARVVKWQNMVSDFPAQDFKSRDKGREISGSGRPTLRKDVRGIGGHNSLIFRRQELVNHKEDAFDHLTTGNGYTWLIVISPYKQVVELEDVNSFFGNLRNSAKYEGFWGGFTDDNRVWIGSRNGITFGRWDKNNPKVLASQSLEAGEYYLLMGRMGSGAGEVDIELFINGLKPVAVKSFPVNPEGNPSKMAIGQERDAVNHPGRESFDGEITRFLLYERPLSDQEMKKMKKAIMKEYKIGNPVSNDN